MEEEHVQMLRGRWKAKVSVDDQGVPGRRVHGRGGSGGASRPQEELWTGVRQQWDEVGGRGRGCSRNGWETWQLARALDHGGAENRTDFQSPLEGRVGRRWSPGNRRGSRGDG